VTQASGQPDIDELLDRAFEAIGDGDRETAAALAGQVLAVDNDNADAEDLLAAPDGSGEIRRLTLMFADVVDSTVLSKRVEPEIYRTVVGSYREQVHRIVDKYEGHIASTKGDGLLAVFGHPIAHENDVQRAVQAGLEITRDVAQLDERARRRFGIGVKVRVGVHRGVVYLDTAEDDLYGFAVNLTTQLAGLAQPTTLVISDAIQPILRDTFELEVRPPKTLNGVDGEIAHYRVIAERDGTAFPLGLLVGREQERACLEAAWVQAQEGQLHTPGVAFRGEAGIGKSRLAGIAADLARQSDALVLELSGSPFHTDVGLRPVRRLLERRLGIDRNSYPAERLRLLAEELDALSLNSVRMIPLLAPVLGIDPRSGYTAVHVEGMKLYGQIVAAASEYLLACMGDEGPVLILVEDIHWFDEDTIEVVHGLLRERTGRVLMVVTGREHAVFPRKPDAVIFELQPLSDAETDQLVLALDPEMAADTRQAVRHRCDGVPLYIEEVVIKLKNQPTDLAGSADVPDTLYEALFVRLRSDGDAVRVAEAAATIGSTVDRKMLMSVVDLNEQTVDDVVRDLIAARVLKPVGDDRWRFRHELLREVAAELSPPSVRRRLHSRIGDALVATAADSNPDWPLAADHYEHAERYMEAAAAYQQASRDARRRGALGEALTYLTHAISQIERAPAGTGRDKGEIALRLRRGFLAQAAEGVSSPKVATDFERCLELCSSDLRDDDLFATVTSLYPYYAMRAYLDRAERLLQSLRMSLTGPREIFLPVNDFALGMLAWYRGEFRQARTMLGDASNTLREEAARELEDMLFTPNDIVAGLYTHLALSRYLDGDILGVEDELARSELRCQQLPFPSGAFSQAYARQIEVLIRLEAGQLERAAAVAVELTTIGEQHGFDSWAMVGTAQQATVSALSWLETNAGDTTVLEGHIGVLTAVLGAWRAHGVIALITFYDAVLARLLLAAGQRDEARDRLEIALNLADQTGMGFYNAELLRLRADTSDDLEAAKSDLIEAIRLAEIQSAPVFELRSATSYYDRFGEDGREVLTAAVAHFPQDSVWPELARARAMLG
jgi:class 3 adenylate cyclase/tetratricopeptide (TPR) repeat protein